VPDRQHPSGLFAYAFEMPRITHGFIFIDTETASLVGRQPLRGVALPL
jgi:hypothetical protein